MATIEERARQLETRVMSHSIDPEKVAHLKTLWETDPRWKGIKRPYSVEDVLKARGTLRIEHTFAQAGAARLWKLLQTEPYIHALGALTGNQAIQQIEAGLKAIYLSGWQVAADANLALEMYPDQSLYPSNSVPAVVKRINNALRRADQIQVLDGRKNGPYWFAPIIADAEAGFGGPLNAFELMKQMIEAGAAGVHFEDQLSSAKKCGHMGGKVLVPTSEFVTKLLAARFAADIEGVPTVLIARTDAEASKFITSDCDERDHEFIVDRNSRTNEGFFEIRAGIDCAIARAKYYAPYADLVWCETSVPDLNEARKFAEGVKKDFPDKLLSYNCSPSFNWKRHLSEDVIKKFQKELAAMGYKFQFVTLAGFHALNLGMFNLARQYRDKGMAAYSEFQEEEFKYEKSEGYMATSHQSFVGAGYFDRVINAVTIGGSDLAALSGSTEEQQFH
jgi:isocitrate lyase